MIRTRPPRRAASAALVAALAAVLALTGAVAAKDHPNKPDKVHPVRTEQQGGGAGPAAVEPSVKVRGNASHPGSVFRVNAVLKAARDVRPETIDAVVHFATGDVEVELTRQGGGAAYHANVPVPDGEPEGTVLIDVTALVDGETLEATGSGKILVRGEGDEEAEALDEPEESPEACEPEASPSPSESPDASPSEEPEPSPSEEPSAEPTESPEPSPSESPEASPSESPDASPSASPEPSSSPDADEAADDDCEDDEGGAGNAQFTAAVLARIIAFVESLMA